MHLTIYEPIQKDQVSVVLKYGVNEFFGVMHNAGGNGFFTNGEQKITTVLLGSLASRKNEITE